MLQLHNKTPFKATITAFPDAEGVDTLYVIVRASFVVLGSTLTVAEAQRPIQLTDEYWGEPAHTSLRGSGELHLLKPSTDVVLLGDAWAPRGRPVSHVDVGVAVGPVRKMVRVFGDREWKGAVSDAISSPVPFDRMPLVYERAFGGVLEIDKDGAPTLVEPRNPVGVGFARQGRHGPMAARKLPNLEDPAHLIKSPGDTPPPAGFGFIAPSWEPRRSFAGTYDEAWSKTRAPYLPADFNPRFFNVAHPDLVCKTHLVGGEPVELLNVSPLGVSRFRLPRCELDVQVRLAGKLEPVLMQMEMVVLEPSEDRVSLLFRGSLRCDKRVLKAELVKIGLQALELGARAA